MTTDHHLSAAILASAAFAKMNFPEGTNAELELRKIYRRFLGLTAKADKAESADAKGDVPANAR